MPPPVFSHTLTEAGDAAYLIGGLSANNQANTSVYRLDFEKAKTYQWLKLGVEMP